ncbi:MAG: rhamnulokinase [Ilumatobacteraceae bacterium]|nr:rhamnulokinase [Ilumatobacteraceae bacterium]
MPIYAAVDLGATSGRVVNVEIGSERISLDLVHRFHSPTVSGPNGALFWEIDRLFSEVGIGLGRAAERARLQSVAIDSWAVDYGLLDEKAEIVGPVHAYRSHRTDGVMESVVGRLGRARIYQVTGIQFLPFNTMYQLAASLSSGELEGASRLLMIPDLINNHLCGSTTNEVTNASTTQLLDARTHRWSGELCEALGIRPSLLPSLHLPGAALGTIRRELTAQHPALEGLSVVAAASHDTASAIAGTPLRSSQPSIYISCGTWALIGSELTAALTTDEALAANVTNELGVGNSIRFLKNVTGLWLLEECRRSWESTGSSLRIDELVAAASSLRGGRAVIDPDDDRLLGSDDMPNKIRAVCQATSQEVPVTPADVTRIIIDSLALSFRRTVRTIETISRRPAEVIHFVGGGSSNTLLTRLTASACERRVLCGPVEATVVGNALVQAISDGVLDDLDQGRGLVESALPSTVVEPEQTLDWASLEDRLAASNVGAREGSTGRRRTR